MSMPTCTSTGDILRELDSRGCIESDSFLLVDSGTISNIDLSTVWKEHEERQKKSSYNIMTSIFSHIPVEEETPRNHEIALIHNDHDRILAYGDIKNMNNFSVITASLLENNQVSVRFDIGQTGIHICSREVLVHFSDNYDYKDIYDDYLAKEVENIEFGYQYYGYFNDNSYARCIKVHFHTLSLIHRISLHIVLLQMMLFQDGVILWFLIMRFVVSMSVLIVRMISIVIPRQNSVIQHMLLRDAVSSKSNEL